MTVFFKKLIYKYLRRLWSKWYPPLPMIELEAKHIANCTILTNRIELLKRLPSQGVVAEIGVERGLFSLEILRLAKPTQLHLVDTWSTPSIEDECRNNLKEQEVEFHKMYSTSFLANVDNKSLDWVYIDTDHTYKTTHHELELAALAVKDNGFICGHDYTAVAYSGLRKYGVVEAVNQFCVSHNYELVYLTSETSRHLSYAIRKNQTT